MDPRLARMDQDLRGPPVQSTPVSVSPAVSANTDPRALNTFNISDKLVSLSC